MSDRTLLGVWAHPDDEAYLSAGLMLEFTTRGDRVVVVTATPGEHGTSDPATFPPERLAEIRRTELRASLAVVGVHEYVVLGYEDGRCAAADRGTAIDTLSGLIADVGPDVIVTFGPDGMTGHPDHRAVSAWTTEAWERSGSAARLWYATVTSAFHDRWGRVNDAIGLWGDQPDPPRSPIDELCHQVVLRGPTLDRKIAALRAHESQTVPLESMIGRRAYRHWWSIEAFREVLAPALTGRNPERSEARS